MQDRNGREIRTGEIVKIVGQYDLPLYNYWIIKGFVDQGLTVEAVLCHYHSGEMAFVSVLDIEKPFGN
jgi:hypothetical protein